MNATPKKLTVLIFVLLLIVTAGVANLCTTTTERSDFFWMSLGFIMYSEVLLCLGFTDFAGNSSRKVMPFKAALNVVLLMYFVFALIMAFTTEHFSSFSFYSIVHLLVALCVTVFIISFYAVQATRQRVDNVVVDFSSAKAQMQLLLGELVETAKSLPVPEARDQVLSDLRRVLDNLRYKANGIPGAEKCDQSVLQQINRIADQVGSVRQMTPEEHQKVIDQLRSDISKLEYLFEQREIIIKGLR